MSSTKGVKKKNDFLKKKILLLLAIIVIFFALAEVTCTLFYDESVNYEDLTWKSLLENKNYLGAYSDKKYIEPYNGLVYRSDNDMLDEEYYTFFNHMNVDKEKKGNKYRIAVLGDSFTVCGGLTNKECGESSYTKRLNDLLDKENVEGISEFEVLVFAVGGINTFQELVIFRELAMLYNPDMVILQYCDNDIRPPMSELGFTGSGLHILSGTRLLLLGDRIVPTLPFVGDDASRVILKNSAFMRFVSYSLNIIISDTWIDAESSFESIKEIDKIADENGMPFIVIDFPPAALEFENCIPEKNEGGEAIGIDLHAELEKITSELDVPFYNMCDHVDDIHSILSTLEGDGCHYNVEGYGIAAEVLKDAVLEKLGVVNNE
ncbi:MAG: SGNH/GDSL hydrolase family protein [Candidatus Aenigmarchaeota archaeon]|nr:SGNH/GDSL hydrolase family protein [Candidatus Aenigmarchaeota archaeon]